MSYEKVLKKKKREKNVDTRRSMEKKKKIKRET